MRRSSWWACQVWSVDGMLKMCSRHPERRCYHNLNCSFIDGLGNVGICPLHDNPSGFFARHKRVPILRSIWNKHSRGR